MKDNQALGYTYHLLDVHAMINVGGNVSCNSGVVLFDNIDEPVGEPEPSRIPFDEGPIKLRLHILLLCIEGEIDYTVDLCEHVVLRKGNVAYLQPGRIVEYNHASPSLKIMLLGFSHERMLELKGLESVRPASDVIYFTPPPPLFLEMITVYRLMKRQMDDPECRSKEEIVNAYLTVSMTVVSEMLARSSDAGRLQIFGADTRQVQIYHRFIDLVRTSFLHHRDASFYADALCLSSGHLLRIVKNVSGMTVSELIREYVILEAKHMLKTGENTILQISERLNFANPSFFSRYFREATGMTPGQYRKS